VEDRRGDPGAEVPVAGVVGEQDKGPVAWLLGLICETSRKI